MPNPTLNRRYQRLIDQLDKVPNATREMFLYLFSMVAVGQGIIEVVRIQEEKGRRIVLMNDPARGQQFRVMYPDGLEPEYADAAVAEMERLLSDESLGTSMDVTLFRKLYEQHTCNHCRYRAESYWQICAECRFAGYPLNYEQPDDR